MNIYSPWGLYPQAISRAQIVIEENQNLCVARITSLNHEIFQLFFPIENLSVIGSMRGKLRRANEQPLVGDWVIASRPNGFPSQSVIEEILPRKTLLSRKGEWEGVEPLLANLDHLIVVTSFNEDLNPRRIERALIMAKSAGVAAHVLINKADLLPDIERRKIVANLRSELRMDSVVLVSAQSKFGMENFLNIFQRGETMSLLGMSGVGKSTLVNHLLLNEVAETQEIRCKDSRGRHTTTSRNLFLSANGIWIIDTPGMRSFGFDAGAEQILDAFSEIQQLMAQCRFSDCQHRSEPHCAIKIALENERLSETRWQSYLKLKREMRFEERKINRVLQSEEQKKWAKLSRQSKVRRQRLDHF